MQELGEGRANRRLLKRSFARRSYSMTVLFLSTRRLCRLFVSFVQSRVARARCTNRALSHTHQEILICVCVFSVYCASHTKSHPSIRSGKRVRERENKIKPYQCIDFIFLVQI